MSSNITQEQEEGFVIKHEPKLRALFEELGIKVAFLAYETKPMSSDPEDTAIGIYKFNTSRIDFGGLLKHAEAYFDYEQKRCFAEDDNRRMMAHMIARQKAEAEQKVAEQKGVH